MPAQKKAEWKRPVVFGVAGALVLAPLAWAINATVLILAVD
jgi:hypothetical protein